MGLISSSASDKNYMTGCMSLCDSIDGIVNDSCSGVDCCQTTILDGIKYIEMWAKSPTNHSNVSDFNPYWAVGKQTYEDAKKNTTGYAFKAMNSECSNSKNGLAYLCNCFLGYQGNPYLSNGCQDIDECETHHECADHAKCANLVGSYTCSCPKGYEGDGWRNGTSCIPKPSNSKNIIIALCISTSLLVLLLGGSSVLLGLKRRKFRKLQEKYFQQNGGLMLQEHILNHGRSMETTKIFRNDELKKATNNYDESRVLGKWGYETVYKGVFSDNKVVAIKKSKAEITTLVQGTLGYLDPEYFPTGQLTGKSDLYSFGVVLAEQLTGEEAISRNRPESDKNLAMYFVSAMKEDRLLDILQDHIVNESNIEQLKEVVNLAKGCLRLRGEDRPTMMEVAMELEGLRIMKKLPRENDNQTTEETEYLPSTPTIPFNIDIGVGSSARSVSGHYNMINQLLKPLDDGR
ncbi:wall-associated receptor kinase 3-like [Juglans regia]|uniref:Wall-associated receptor kinase 3-like n=1 Tax=Juglans regia TaxID=51240 RepID=A0A6P9EGP8_JUGRE|nr:wall-associated receptor kinase 3-like [Juglans regia]